MVRQLQERTLVQPARVLAQLQEGRRGLGTHQQEAWLSNGLSAGRWLRSIPCLRPTGLILISRMTLLRRPFYRSVRVSKTPRARHLRTARVVLRCLPLFARLFDAVLRVATTGMVARYYGPNEDLGLAHFLGDFEGDTLGLARTALTDTPPSDGAVFRLHGALLSLLRAYLQRRAAKLWREACD